MRIFTVLFFKEKENYTYIYEKGYKLALLEMLMFSGNLTIFFY